MADLSSSSSGVSSIQTSLTKKVDKLLPEDATLCPTHKYLIALSTKGRNSQRRIPTTHEDELALKFRETFSKIGEELQINKALYN